MCSDHDKFTAGGSVSNHHFGRGMDIGGDRRRDRRPGQPARARGRERAVRRSIPDIRPNEIGSPFAIAGPGYFTDAAHQNHLHIGFKQEITPDWKPPADVAAAARRRGRRAAVATAAASAAAAGRRRAPPPRRPRPPPERRSTSSQMFLKAVDRRGGARRKPAKRAATRRRS